MRVFVIAKHIVRISIHAPHTGRDPDMVNKAVTKMKFQSTRPIRGATIFVSALVCTSGISIHAPHTGRDRTTGAGFCTTRISIHAPHTGRDRGYPI